MFDATQDSLRWYRARTVVLAALACGAWLAYGLLAQPRHNIGTLNQLLYVDAAKIDLGTLWQQDEVHCTVPVVNRSTTTVTLEGWYPLCGGRAIEPQRLVLGPGESASVNVVLDLTDPCLTNQRHLQVAGQTRRTQEPTKVPSFDFIAWLAPRVDPSLGVASVGWPIRGHVLIPFTVHPEKIDLPEAVRGELSPPVGVWVYCYTDTDSLLVECPAHLLITVNDTAKQAAALKQTAVLPLELEVRVRPDAPTGPFEVSVPVRVRTRDGAILGGKKLMVTGRVVPTVAAYPAPLALGITPVGSAVSEQVSLRSRIDEPFEVLEILNPHNDITVEPLPSDDPLGKLFRVTTVAMAEGEIRREITFRIKSAGRNEEELVPVTLVMYATQTAVPQSKPR
jgi:hypothetical protein